MTAGDTPLFSSHRYSHRGEETVSLSPQEQVCAPQPALKLSQLLRPLGNVSSSRVSNRGIPLPTAVQMPSYLSSTTLGQTITDPIGGGILAYPTAVALFEHFMIDMNAKWENVLDPLFDKFDDVRQRSPLLLASVLFCSSKFASVVDGELVLMTDPFLQSRLCSLARNLAVRMFALGDRTIETMQAFYLLACWKEPDDDISYLHSGYAFRILLDLDLSQTDRNERDAARYRRTYLALFRQDKQQSLFFMRGSSLSANDETRSSFLGELDDWLKLPRTLPSDFLACCNTDLRRKQARLRKMAHKSSLLMFPCVLDLMNSELDRWRSTWRNHIGVERRFHPDVDPAPDPRLLSPGKSHVDALVGLWEQSVRLSVASVVLRQALLATVKRLRPNDEQQSSSLSLDIPTVVDMLATDFPGLESAIEGAFGTLRQLLLIPPHDLRRSPDSFLLLGPNAALFLCLLLCLPCKGLLGHSFQKAATSLIEDLARHVARSVQSPQDSVALHASYLDSLVRLLNSNDPHDSAHRLATDDLQSQAQANELDIRDTAVLEATQTSADDTSGLNNGPNFTESIFEFPSESGQDFQAQTLANLLELGSFWTMPNVEDCNNLGPT